MSIKQRFGSFFGTIGPALIVAAVVCGPGSILSSSKVGAEFGYSMVWALALAAILMVSMVSLAAHLGLADAKTPCGELAEKLGRPVAAAVGIVLFLIVACFQSSNNIAVVAGLEPLFESEEGKGFGKWVPVVLLAAVNALAILALYRLRGLYKKVEKLMKGLVLLMVIAFLVNCIAAGPSLLEAMKGLIPRLPEGMGSQLVPRKIDGTIVDPFWGIQAMIVTTFSVAAAFYQAYLVRERGWTLAQGKEVKGDVRFGIGVLAGITLVIMLTSASVFYGKVPAGSLQGVGDVARQLEPLFGPWAKILFCIGIFAGAFSSFLVNAMVGGTIVADGLGLGEKIDGPWSKHFTAAALLLGMVVALLSIATGMDRVGLIIFAQALTVLGLPALALALLYLGSRPELVGERKVAPILLILAGISFLITLFLAVRTAVSLTL